jgi:hypothetical protein
MKKLMTTLAMGLALTLGAAHAADDKKAPTAQQSKMTVCNKEAGDRKGDERKKFMSECLSAEHAVAADKRTAQQDRMKQCNLDAKDKKGDERKKFMSTCLSGKPAEPAASDKKTAQQERMKQCNLDAKDKKGDERKKFMSECLKSN